MGSRRKVATNLSMRADFVAEAKRLGVNLSEVCEEALAQVLQRQRQERWLEENREAIESYNAQVARNGVFSDRWRKF
jgi:antitoxin CcdA